MSAQRKLKILVVDDNPKQIGPLKTLLNMNSTQYEISDESKDAISKEAAFKLLENEVFDMIFLDIIWENGGKKAEGINILEEIRRSIYGNYPVIMLTNYPDQGYQKPCLDLGCDGFLAKELDLETERLSSVEYIIEKALRMGELRKSNLIFEQDVNEKMMGREKTVLSYRKPIALIYEKGKSLSKDYQRISLYGSSKPMTELFQEIIRIAAEPDSPNVMIGGGTGVGKSTIARLIHFLSVRSDGPFHEVIVNAIPHDLVESTLFGIEAGVATQVKAGTGIIEKCNNGTLFLDEIGDLPLGVQVKLLRVIREKVITKVGGEDIKIDFKLISATNRDLRTLVKEGTFRLDLFQRICGVELTIPSLQKRLQDDPSELDDLIKQEMRHRRFTFVFTDSAKKCMFKHDWPGNYAEFKTLIDNLSLESSSFVDEDMIMPKLLRIDETFVKSVSSLSEILNISNHRLAVNAFKRKHVQYWIKKEGNLKGAAAKMEMDESTIHRILGKEHEQ